MTNEDTNKTPVNLTVVYLVGAMITTIVCSLLLYKRSGGDFVRLISHVMVSMLCGMVWPVLLLSVLIALIVWTIA